MRTSTQILCLALSGFFAIEAIARDAPLPTDLEEQAQVRLRTVRIRIEPARRGDPGVCLALGPADLDVRLRGERIRDPRALRLERESRPAVHALVVDTSGSMLGQLEHVDRAASGYLDALPEGGRVLVVTFDDSVVLAVGPTADRDAVREAIGTVRLGSRTSLNDALYYTTLSLGSAAERPVVLLLTDGVDTASFHERSDMLDLAAAGGDVVVFSIGLGLPPLQRGGPPELSSMKRFLQTLAARTGGEFFDVPTGSRLDGVYRRIRELLDGEATLTVVDPDPEADPGTLRVSSENPHCKVSVLPTREGATREPLPEAPSPPPWRGPFGPEADLVRPHTHLAERATDAACLTGAGAGYVVADVDGLRGCAVDVAMDYGTLYDPYVDGWLDFNEWLAAGMRPFSIPLPPLAELPAAPEAVMDRLAARALERSGAEIERAPRKVPADEHARPYHDFPELQSGTMFLERRPAIARAVYALPEYWRFARRRLEEEARARMAALSERYRERFPDVPAEVLERAVAESDEGREILARSRAPSAHDAARYLAAWLGDVSAHDLFVRWEALQADEILRDPSADRDLAGRTERWRALREVFFVPSYARVLALLFPVRDAENDRVGFWRVVLPRPAWLIGRVKGWKRPPEVADLPLDLIPDVPFGLWLLDHLERTDPGTVARWRDAGYRVESVSYELLEPARKRDPRRAFRRVIVRMELASGGERVEARGEMRLDGVEARVLEAGRPAEYADTVEETTPERRPRAR